MKNVYQTRTTIYDQGSFYSKHRKEFSEAVEQFTDLLCHYDIPDILGQAKDVANRISKGKAPRFDNLLLHVDVEGLVPLYKIGLIDMENICQRDPTHINIYKAISTATQLFPYHFDAILEVAIRKNVRFCEIEMQSLQEMQKSAHQLYQIVCDDHLNFLRRHDITLDNPSKSVEITPERRKELHLSLKSFLLIVENRQSNDEIDPSEFYYFAGKTMEEKAVLLDCFIPKLLDIVADFLKKLPQEQFEDLMTLPTSLEQLIQLRAGVDIPNNIFRRLDVSGLVQGRPNGFYNNVFDEIFRLLAKGGEISYF